MSPVSVVPPPPYVTQGPDTAVGPDAQALRLSVRSVSAQFTSATSHTPVAAQFVALAATWQRDTMFSSSLTDIVLHPAYQRIIGMGPSAIPLIARELKRAPHFWFDALTALTGADPILESHRGSVPHMTTDWLDWLAQRGIVA